LPKKQVRLSFTTPCERLSSGDKYKRRHHQPTKNTQQFPSQPKDEPECLPDEPNRKLEKQQGNRHQRQQVYE